MLSYNCDIAASLDRSIQTIWTDRSSKKINSTDFIGIDNNRRSWSPGQNAVGLNARHLSIITKPKLLNSNGFIQLNSGIFIRDTYWEDSQLYDTIKNQSIKSLMAKLLIKRAIQLKGEWYSMLLYYSRGFFHWFCDVLPCLYKVQELLPKDISYIIHENPPGWMQDSLEFMGISLENCYEFNFQRPLNLEHLYFTPPVAMTGDHDPDALRWVRHKILEGAKIDPFPKPKLRLYISRSKAKCRRIINEEKLLKKLLPYNFQLVHPETLSLRQQIDIFSQAEWIVAPHGAGLTNILYATAGAKVLEFFEPSILRRCYHQMSGALNHDHYIGVGETIPNGNNEPDIYLGEHLLDLVEKQIEHFG